MKKALVLLVVLVFCFSAVAVSYADGGYGKKCGYQGKYGQNDGPGQEEMVLKKAHLILSNKEELDLSDKQYDQIKAMKIALKKALIKKNADIDLVKVDMKVEMWEDKADTASIEKLIDKKYDLKKEKAKMIVKTCADMKNVLTQDQKDTLKGLCKKSKR